MPAASTAPLGIQSGATTVNLFAGLTTNSTASS
jgi:hypothetical protein